MTTFLLCIGCQKGGTTWLSEYLRGFPEVRLGARKEMHVLDGHFVPGNRDWHQVRIDRRLMQLARVRARGGEPRLTAQLEAEIAAYREAEALIPDLDAYAAYFRRIADAVPRARLVADLTPDYALLGAEDWRVVRETLVRHGFAPRILFLMRDPVGRLESVYRMVARDEAYKSARGLSLSQRAARRLVARARHLATRLGVTSSAGRFVAFALEEANLDRSRFETTIAAIEASFPQDEVHYDFYETLFTPEVLEKIMGFLDLPMRPAEFSERVNASPMLVPVAPKERAEVRGMLDATYRYCADRFGAHRISAIWKNV